MASELKHCMRRASEDESVAVLILTGKGRAFSAGGDLENFKKAYETFQQRGVDESFADAQLPMAFIDFPKPMIAAVNGPAVGFGLTVGLTCDIRLASDQALFNCAFVRVGVTPEFGSSYFLPRLVGFGKAAELTLTASTIDADEALRIGLVNRVVPHDKLMEEAVAMADTISRLPREAILHSKALLRHGYHSTLEQVINYENLTFRSMMHTEAHYQAICKTIEQIASGNTILSGPSPETIE
jgi:2-(1,2-epoxy-1,2-dihydrophenyl)acetyl-CoA isomerase